MLAPERGLLPEAQSVSAVVVSTLPAASSTPTTRGTLALAVPERLDEAGIVEP